MQLDRLIGATIADRFEIDVLLGQGGMGAVFRARYLATGAAVALKVVLPRKDYERRLLRFQREARLSARLHHPNVVRILDFGRWGPERDRHYLAMELVDGLSLSELLDAGLSTASLCGLVSQVARGLAHVHARDVLHRDIKPDNVLVEQDDQGTLRAKLTDFGIAAALREDEDRLTDDGTILGTPDYVAPEQVIQGTVLGMGVDLYPLGVILYRALSGKMPFAGSVMQALHRKVNEDPPLLHGRDGEQLDPGLSAVVRRLMARRPHERYLMAADVVEALKPFADEPRLPPGRWQFLLRGLRGGLGGAGATEAGRGTITVPLMDPLARGRIDEMLWGRDEHLDLAEQCAQGVEEGVGRVLLLDGAKGMGKSTFVRRVSVDLHEAGRFSVLRAACHGRTGLEQALRLAVDQRLGTVGQPPSVVRTNLLSLLRAAEEGAPSVDFINDLLGFLRPETVPAVAQVADRARMDFAVCLRLLRTMTADRPVLLTIDDLDLASAETAAFFELLFFELAMEEFPILVVVGLAEVNDVDLMRFRKRVEQQLPLTVVHSRLGPLDAAELARGLVEVQGLSREQAHRIAAQVGGNPMFAMLLAESPDDYSDPGLVVSPESTDRMPPELARVLNDMLNFSVARCSSPERALETLEHLAVLGEGAEVPLLAIFLDRVDHLDRDLEELVERGILVESGSEDRFSFMNVLLRDIVQSGLSADRHTILHRRAACLFLDRGEPGDEGIAGDHWSAAGDVERAADGWFRAMSHADNGGDGLVASHWARKALSHLEPLDVRWGQAAIIVGRGFEEAGDLQAAVRGLEPLLRHPDADLALLAGEALCEVEQKRANGTGRERALENMELRAADAGPVGMAALERSRSFSYRLSGQGRAAIDAARRALDLAAPGEEAVKAAIHLCWAGFIAEDPSTALQAAELALQLAGPRADLQADATQALFFAYGESGRSRDAVRTGYLALDMQRRAGRPSQHVAAANDLATGMYLVSHYDRARRHAGEALDSARSLGLGMEELKSRLLLVLCDLAQGIFGGTSEQTADLLTRTAHAGSAMVMGLTRLAHVWALVAEGRHDEVGDWLNIIGPSTELPANNYFAATLEHTGLALMQQEFSRERGIAYLRSARLRWELNGYSDRAQQYREWTDPLPSQPGLPAIVLPPGAEPDLLSSGFYQATKSMMSGSDSFQVVRGPDTLSSERLPALADPIDRSRSLPAIAEVQAAQKPSDDEDKS